jgi:hypothetical protein
MSIPRSGIIDKHVMLILLNFCSLRLVVPEKQSGKTGKASNPKDSQRVVSGQ